ncbi:MAG TPA: hypothetical protein V6C81_26760 [Planktothrix sp.]|jgi:hypothetical protein
MLNTNSLSNESIKERCDSVDAKAQYAQKQLGQPDAEAAGRLAVIDGLSGLARQLGASASEFFSAACSLQAAEQVERRRQSAYKISVALLDVAEAQTVPLLAKLPAFTVPARQRSTNGGGAASLSMWSQPKEDPALQSARTAIVETVQSLKAFTADGKQFAPDSDAGKFMAAFLASAPTSEAAVEAAVESAFDSTQK